MTAETDTGEHISSSGGESWSPVPIVGGGVGATWCDGIATAASNLSASSVSMSLLVAGGDVAGVDVADESSEPVVGVMADLVAAFAAEGIDADVKRIEILSGPGTLSALVPRAAAIVADGVDELVVVHMVGTPGVREEAMLVFADPSIVEGDAPITVDGYASTSAHDDASRRQRIVESVENVCRTAHFVSDQSLEHARFAPSALFDDVVGGCEDALRGLGAPRHSCVMGGTAGPAEDVLAGLFGDLFTALHPATCASVGEFATALVGDDSPLCVTAVGQPWVRDRRNGSRRAIAISADGAHLHTVALSGRGTVAGATPVDWVGRGAPAIVALSGADGAELVAAARRVRAALVGGADLYCVAASAACVEPSGPLRAAIVAADRTAMIDELRAAEATVGDAVDAGRVWVTPGGSHCDPTLAAQGGRVAFVYPGTYASYPGAEAEIFHLFPGLLAGTEAFSERPAEAFAMSRQYLRGSRPPTPAEIAAHELELRSDIGFMSTSAVQYAMLGTSMMRDLIGVVPEGVFGYSLGELGMLFATDLWSLRDGMGLGVQRSTLFRTELYGERSVVRAAWQIGDDVPDDEVWITVAVAAAPADIRRAIAEHDRVFITHINTDSEVLIAGDPRQCAAVVEQLGARSFLLPGGGPVLHVPLIDGGIDGVRALTRHDHGSPDQNLQYLFAALPETTDRPPNEVVAQTIIELCRGEVDFPALCRRAHRAGYRYFIEIGPGSDCTRWIRANLGDVPHVAVALDRRKMPQRRAIARALATLIGSGLDIDLNRLFPAALADAATIAAVAGAGVSDGEVPDRAEPDDAVPDDEAPNADAPDVGVPDDEVIVLDSWVGGAADAATILAGGAGGSMSHVPEMVPSDSTPIVSPAVTTDIASDIASGVRAPLAAETRSGVSALSTAASSVVVDGDRHGNVIDAHLAARIGILARNVAVTHIEALRTQSTLQSLLLDQLGAMAPHRQSPTVTATAVTATTATSSSTGIATPPALLDGGTVRHRIADLPDDMGGLGVLDRLPAMLSAALGSPIDAPDGGLRIVSGIVSGCDRRALPGPVVADVSIRPVDGSPDRGAGFDVEFGDADGVFLTLRDGLIAAPSVGAGTSPGRARLAPIAPHTRSDRVLRRKGFKPLEYTGRTSLSASDLHRLADGDIVGVFGPRWDQSGVGTNDRIRLCVGEPAITRVTSIDRTGGEFRLGTAVAEQDLNGRPVGVAGIVEAAAQVLRALTMYLGLHLVFSDAEFLPQADAEAVVDTAIGLLMSPSRLTYRVELTDITMIARPTIVADVHVFDGDALVAVIRAASVQVRERPGTRLRPELDDAGRPLPVGRRGRRGEVAFLNEFHLSHMENGDVAVALGAAVDNYRGKTVLHIPSGEFRFVDRVLTIAGDRMALRSGSMTSEYDAATESWYYEDNSFDGMPGSVIMESSLQAAAMTGVCLGTTLRVPPDLKLSVRNLDGTATVLADVDLRGATLRQETTLLSTTHVAGQILQRFSYRIDADGVPVYEGQSLFGYFTAQALASDMGLDAGKPVGYWIDGEPEARARAIEIDYRDSDRWTGRVSDNGLRLGSGHYRLIDRATVVPDGGRHGKGYVTGVRAIAPDDWYFSCHFHEDPVMPGSLGVESVMQALQTYVVVAGVADHLRSARFALALDVPFTWTYRGQILRDTGEMGIEVDVTDVRTTSRGLVVTADASVFKPGVRIYHLSGVAVEIIADDETADETDPVDSPRLSS